MALRIRQAWAQLAVGDPTAAQATLARLEPGSDGERAAHLVAEAAAAWFRGDVEEARRAAAQAQPLAGRAGLPRDARTAIQIQAMVAHSSGEWTTALRQALEESLRAPDFADTLFDGHLCVAEYALTSSQPHPRIRTLAEELHATAVRSGARRAQVFAATLLGEVALVAGRTKEADRRLREAVTVSREIGAVSAEALARLRLGETARARGEMAEGEALLSDALLISRWSPLSAHLQALSHAAALRATDDAELGLERLEDAEADRRGELVCAYCGLAFRVAVDRRGARRPARPRQRRWRRRRQPRPCGEAARGQRRSTRRAPSSPTRAANMPRRGHVSAGPATRSPRRAGGSMPSARTCRRTTSSRSPIRSSCA